MSEQTDVLATYRQAAAQIERFVADMPRPDYERRERPADWSVRQIVHHLADVEVGDAMRLRQMIAHDAPLIVAYDEEQFAARLHYERPIASSLAAYVALRASNGAILELLADADWSRSGRHEERDRYTVDILVRKSIDHDQTHLAQMQRALQSTA